MEGCIRRGIPEEVANHVFDEMIDFAKYAFNKSHAAAYAVVAYQTAWLRCYYPLEFHGCPADFRDDESKKNHRVYQHLPEHGDNHPAAGH